MNSYFAFGTFVGILPKVGFARETRRSNLCGISQAKSERVRRTWLPTIPFIVFLQFLAFCRPEILGFFAIRLPRCQTVLTSW
jgi:hypothetical protein